MNMIYNSPLYCVVEFPAAAISDGSASATSSEFIGGYEIMDKLSRREIFLDGAVAQAFRDQVSALIEGEPSMDEIDDFLGGFAPLMQQPVVLH